MISDEAVEAATEAMLEVFTGENEDGDVYVQENSPTRWVVDGTVNLPYLINHILEAAAPILLSHERQLTADAHRDAIVNRDNVDRLERELEAAKADAWDVAYWIGREDEQATRTHGLIRTNPYRSQT